MMQTRLFAAVLAALFLVACGEREAEHPQTEPIGETADAPSTDPLAGITDDALHEHISVLASDEFEGRAPSSPGEEKTVAYLVEQFQRIGIDPGNGGSYTQDVPLVAIASEPTPMTFATPEGEMTLDTGEDFVAWTKRVIERTSVEDSELVFVGYGVVAPEYGWDDYRGLDVEGKTVVMLVNDPGFGSEDDALFTGKAMTYYGRWTYKFEEAARQGAAAAIVIHQTAPASYGWEVVRGSWTGEQFSLVSADRNMSRAAIESWITEDVARALFSASLLFSEAFVVLFAGLVAYGLQLVPTPALLWGGGALALWALLAGALVRRGTAGYVLGSMLQLALVATGIILPMMFVLGGLFAVLWLICLRVGGQIDAERVVREAEERALAESQPAHDPGPSAAEADVTGSGREAR